jgi:dienelactone hydrolase
MSHDVYVTGDGPPVLVMHELSGMNATAVDFARRLAREGFRVYLPHLFGKPLQAAAPGAPQVRLKCRVAAANRPIGPRGRRLRQSLSSAAMRLIASRMFSTELA